MVTTPEAKINKFVVYGSSGRGSVSVGVIPKEGKRFGRGNEAERQTDTKHIPNNCKGNELACCICTV